MPRKKGLIALFGFVVFFIICAYTFHPHLPSIPIYPVARAQWEASEKVVAVVPPTPSSVRIYIGVVSNPPAVVTYLMTKVTAWWNFAARSILREAYTHFRIDRNDVVTIRFVVGLPGEDEHGMMDLLHWEQDRFGDLQVLNQRENMNEGKTFEYFSSLARMYPAEDPQERPYDYAMKADDDTFVNIPLLLERLRPMTPREDSYIVLLSVNVRSDDRAEGPITGIWERGTFCRGI
jgi:Galactosyltransferase